MGLSALEQASTWQHGPPGAKFFNSRGILRSGVYRRAGVTKTSLGLLTRQGQPFSLRSRNKVHDSTENTAAIIEAPIALYLIESAYVTKVRERYAKYFDFHMGFDLALDIGLGGSLNNITDWDYTKPHLLEITENSIDWMKSELGYKLKKDKLMRGVEHNADLIHKIRRKELKEDSGKMLLTAKNVHKVGFQFADPSVN